MKETWKGVEGVGGRRGRSIRSRRGSWSRRWREGKREGSRCILRTEESPELMFPSLSLSGARSFEKKRTTAREGGERRRWNVGGKGDERTSERTLMLGKSTVSRLWGPFEILCKRRGVRTLFPRRIALACTDCGPMMMMDSNSSPWISPSKVGQNFNEAKLEDTTHRWMRFMLRNIFVWAGNNVACFLNNLRLYLLEWRIRTQRKFSVDWSMIVYVIGIIDENRGSGCHCGGPVKPLCSDLGFTIATFRHGVIFFSTL